MEAGLEMSAWIAIALRPMALIDETTASAADGEEE